MLKRDNKLATQRGFTLPVILLISVGLMIIGLSLLQSTTSVRNSLEYQYQQRLASEAAEAGTVYANYCLSANNFTQAWGPANSKPNLSQETDCTGTIIASSPDYLLQNGTKRTGFSIGDLTIRSDGAIIFSSSGIYQQTRGNTSLIAQSFASTRKQVVKWKTYLPSVSASGTSKTCSIVSNELYCWGKNSTGSEPFGGQLGNGTTTDSLVPVKVIQAPGVLAGKVVDEVFSAQYHNCALAIGKVYCWGSNNIGQLGQGTTGGYSSVPVEVGGALSGKTVTVIGGSGDTSCAIAEDKIYCWGRNNKGQMGINSTTNVNLPTAVNTTNLGGSYTATALSTSGSRSYNMCAIANSGKAYCWGTNEAGQIGNGTNGATNILVPTAVQANSGDALYQKTVTAISQDGYYSGAPAYPHVCAVADGAVYCWGDNNSGQLGRAANNTTDSNVPVAVYAGGILSGKTIQNVVVGLQHSCVVANSKAYCWGNRASGQVGDGVTSGTPAYVPTAVSEISGGLLGKSVTAIGGGANRGCALAGYQAYCWGLNTDGQLGDGTQLNRNSPTESVFLRPKAPAYIF